MQTAPESTLSCADICLVQPLKSCSKMGLKKNRSCNNCRLKGLLLDTFFLGGFFSVTHFLGLRFGTRHGTIISTFQSVYERGRV